ncbi:MAG: ABC transporter permease [Ktedonobacterales bacterium]
MNRLKLYWNYATRSLRRGGQRTLLAIFCIAVGVMAIVSLELVGNMVNTALTGNVRGALGGDISVQNGIGPFNQQQLGVFANLKANGTLTQYTAVVDTQVQAVVNGQAQRFELFAVDPSVFPLAGAPDFSDPSNGSLSSLVSGNTVVVTDSLLSQLGLHRGDQLRVESPSDGRSFSATIGGVIYTSGFFDQPEMLVSIDTYAALPSSEGVPVQYNAVYANVPGHTNANQDKAASALSQALPAATITTAKQELQQNQSAVQNLRYFMEIVGVLALLIGGVGIVNTMQVLLRRRQVEIAMLKTSGYRQADLYALFGVEAALLGLMGGVVGVLAGIGAALVVKTVVENAVLLHLSFAVDPGTLLGGVAIGLFTALIFGIMPIVQAGQIRPQALLRDPSLGYTASSAALTVFLVVLLGVLFFVLSAVILGSIQLALLLVLIGVVVLGILTAAFTLVVYLISQLPVPESLNLGFAGLVCAGVVVFGGLTWLGFTHGWSGIPAMTALFTAISLLGLVVAFVPRTWKSTIKMALRNIGRQRTRTVTTMVALFIGVFAIGLILAIGIGIRNDINGLLSSGTTYNAFIGVNAANKAAVDKELSKISGIKGELVNTVAPVQPVSVNGQPIDTIVKAAATQGASGQLLTSAEVLSYLSHAVGYNLAANQIPVLNIVSGRNLAAGDAGTNNVIMSVRSTVAPLSLSVGSQIVLLGPDGKTTRTVTVVGFYTTSTGGPTISVNGGSMIADDSVPVGLAHGRELYTYSLILNPNKAAADLNKVVEAVPSAETVSLAEATVAINSILNNLIIMLTAIASLAMIAGVVIIANAVALAMLERRREQGILKSVGYTSASVLSEVLVENGVVGFTGGVLAMLLVSFALFILGLQVKALNFGVETGLVLVIIFGTTFVSVVVALLVAWNATRVRPLEVLRYE